MNHRLDTDDAVYFYENDFYVLSNFSAFRLHWKGHDFDTSEAAYHWQKFGSHPDIQRLIRKARSAHEAFKIAELNHQWVIPDWPLIKVDVMRDILRAKVDQHQYVCRKLVETGSRRLVEDSWRDAFWGIGPHGDGENMMGRLWEEIRGEIIQAAGLYGRIVYR